MKLPLVAKRERPLVAEFPAIARAVPFRPIAFAPTLVENATGIEAYLGRGGVFSKRDDRISPLYGGNKIRRFEYLLADAEQRGARRLLTVGGFASTQVTATILLGKALGFDVSAVLFEQPITSFARAALLGNAAASAELVYGGGYLATALRTLRAYRASDSPYLIFPGASTPMANLGYVDAMLELGEQVRRGEAPRPDIIVVPAGSAGTLAALAVGTSILRWPTLLVGVRITELVACNRATVRFLIGATLRYLAKRARSPRLLDLAEARFALHHGAIGKGYGHPTPEAIAAIPEVERLTGAPGEVTYSGKGLVGLKAIAAAHPRATILYWNTLSSVKPVLPPVEKEALPRAFHRLFNGPAPV